MAERVVALSVDTGGTFTDVIAQHSDGETRITKVLSAEVRDPAALAATLVGWLSADSPLELDELCDRVVYATTVGTNALLMGDVPPTCLVTTTGFRDVLEIGRSVRPSPLDLTWQPRPPLVPDERRHVVVERIAADGTVVQPLKVGDDGVAALAEAIGGVDAVAVCLLNSHVNGEHERQIGAWISERAPQLFVSLSHEVNAELREYERTSTTVVNAALGPVFRDHLGGVNAELREAGLDRPLEIMQSSGGTVPVDHALVKPAALVESGPAAGALGAAVIARLLEADKVLALDMGGTTTKASLVEGYEVLEAPEYFVGGSIHGGNSIAGGDGYVIRMPTVDVAEVGAGGGSIAWFDEAGGLHIGPKSAGADPGPACYGLGGAKPTVTDANLVVGYLNPHAIAGGQQSMHLDLATRALEAEIGGPRGMSALEAAWLVHVGANARMLAALRSVSIERGRDPRAHLLMAFGGSGPVHAAGVAELLEMDRVFVPFGAGVLSAAGLRCVGQGLDEVSAFHAALDAVDGAEVRQTLEGMRDALIAKYQPSEHALSGLVTLAMVRYAGQSTELSIPLRKQDLDRDREELREAMRARFEELYEREFGFVLSDRPCEITALRIRVREARLADMAGLLRGIRAAHGAGATNGGPRRPAVFSDARAVDCPIVGIESVTATRAEGPLIIESADTTVVVPPGWSIADVEIGLLLRREG